MTNREAPRQSVDAGSNSAMGRLDMIRARQLSLADELTRNWQGWLGSLGLHGAILLLFAAMGAAVVQATQPETWRPVDVFSTRPDDLQLLRERPEDLFNDSTVDSDIDGTPSVDTDVLRPVPGYNELTPGVPDWIGVGSHLDGDLGEGGGGGKGLAGRRWTGYRQGLQRTGLDIVFCFDSTGSMGGIILECKTRIRQLTKVVTYLVPNARIGIVTYRDAKKYDLDDYEYTVKYLPLQKCNKEGLDKIQRFLRETEAYGGGDIPEMVQVGLDTAISKCDWRPGAKRVIIVFGDAPPHAEDNGLSTTYSLCKKWKDAGGVVSTIDTTGGSKIMDEFRQMAQEGGGEASFLNDERAIIRQLVVQIFGSQWKEHLDPICDKFMRDHEDTVVTP